MRDQFRTRLILVLGMLAVGAVLYGPSALDGATATYRRVVGSDDAARLCPSYDVPRAADGTKLPGDMRLVGHAPCPDGIPAAEFETGPDGAAYRVR